MMGLHELELMARGGSLSLLALWSWLLLRDHRELLAAKLAVAMNFGIASYLIVTAGWAEVRSPLGFAFALGAGATPGLFWLFARAWFADQTEIGRWPWLLFVVSVLNVAVLQLTFWSKPPIFYVSAIAFRVGMFAFAAAGLWEAWRGRDGDLVEGRRRLRSIIIGIVGAYVVLISCAEMSVYQLGAPRWIIAVIGSSVVFVTLAVLATMLGFRQSDLLGVPTRPQIKSSEDVADDPLAQRLFTLMDRELPHREEAMTIAKLAALLGEQEYRLRRLINGRLGHRNFATFLNGYRLAEVKQALADPEQREVPILTIALDAGFGSLGPFNRAFREAEGTTPSAWRAARL